MSFDSAKKSIDLLLKISGSEKQLIITLFGGEPLIEFGLLTKIVGYGQSAGKINRKKIQFNIVTNGTKINRKALIFFKKNNMSVLLSMDGDKNTQNLQRPFLNKKDSFREVLSGLENLKRHLGEKLVINMVITKSTAKSFYTNVLFFKDRGINKIAFNVTYEEKWDKNDLKIFEKEFDKIISLWVDEYKQGRLLWLQPLHHFIKHELDNKNKVFYWAHPCIDNRIAISVGGDIFPCHRMVAFKQYNLGNINNGLNKAKLEQYLNQKKELFKKYPFRGGCPALNYETNGDVCMPVKSFKQFYKIYEKGAKKIIAELT